MSTTKLILATLFALTAFLFFFPRWSPIRSQTYFLSAGTKPGWVTIEYENPKCSALKDGPLSQEHVIPPSGYLCTSSRRETNWVYRNYYLVKANGERRALTEDTEIFQEGTIYLDPANSTCNVVADSFWYGPQEQIDNQRHEALKQHHPECNKGLVTPIN